MKISMYELLGMIKDGKMPKKIIFNGYEYSYHDKEHGYCRSAYDSTYICLDTDYYLFDILNDEVEILEEEKKIPEKITINDNGTLGFPNGQWTARNMDKAFAVKINQLIDYLESKGE